MTKLFSLLSLMLLVGCVSHAEEVMTPEAVTEAARAGIVFVDNEHIQARQAANADLVLVDVRTESEFSMAHIPGATWIPRGKAEFVFAETVRDAETEIILYCRTGSRAALVKKALYAQGYKNVSAHEGFVTWAEAGLPVQNDLGQFKMLNHQAQ
ncbi:MAG: rhodanese-like domain-containing protein [Henriciella sp.]|nr:rhodanese-like domain-containing protein [Hyphomonadaceae bacterium]